MIKKINTLIAILSFAGVSATEQTKIAIPRIKYPASKTKQSMAHKKREDERDRAKKLVERPGFQEEILAQYARYGLNKETVEKACKFFKNQPSEQFPKTAQGIEELSKKYDNKALYIRNYQSERSKKPVVTMPAQIPEVSEKKHPCQKMQISYLID